MSPYVPKNSHFLLSYIPPPLSKFTGSNTCLGNFIGGSPRFFLYTRTQPLTPTFQLPECSRVTKDILFCGQIFYLTDNVNLITHLILNQHRTGIYDVPTSRKEGLEPPLSVLETDALPIKLFSLIFDVVFRPSTLFVLILVTRLN